MTTSTAIKTTENWNWADEVLAGSEFADFEVDDCEFSPETGYHLYFDEKNNGIAVTPLGDVTEIIVEE
jgi:hypothetical protein